jgi:hypothetical protein
VTRRIVSVIAAAAMIFAMMPAFGALASAAATANLNESSRQVFPGAQNLSISVRNAENGFLGGVGGKSINWVRIILPTSRGFTLGAGPVTQDGWTVSETRTSSSQTLTYFGGALAAGSTTAFEFPVNVARPANSDREGPIQVLVSSNGGQTAEPATGNLTSLVKILEVVRGHVVAPALAANGTASAGQLVDYRVRVRNHAANEVAVAPSLTPRDGDQIEGGGAARSIPGGGTVRVFDYQLRMNPTITRDATHRYIVGAAKSDGSSAAGAREFTHDVQLPPSLRLIENTFSPRYVQGNSIDYRFTAELQKTQTPALTIDSGTLSFADTTVAIDTVQSSTTWAGNVQQPVVTQRTKALGPDGEHRVTYVFNITDGNGHSFSQTLQSAGNLVDIDALDPIIRNLQASLPGSQTDAKNDDRITITGQVEDRNADPAGLDLTLRVLGGREIPVPQENISTSNTSNGFSFSAEVRPDFGTNEGLFIVEAEAADRAGNTGDAVTDSIGIDNLPPVLGTQGYLLSPNTIEVLFEENKLLLGGCNPMLYSVGGSIGVRSVSYSDGSPCQSGEGDPNGSNTRILTLWDSHDRGWETTVTYNPNNALGQPHSDRARDGAASFVGRAVQDVISLVAPPIPTLDTVTRNGGSETAVFDEDRFWTRFPGNDAQLRITSAGVRSGDVLQVLDARGQVIANSTPAPQNSTALTVTVPIGSTDGDYARNIRLVSARNVPGDVRNLTVALDRVAPQLVAAEAVDANNIRVTFNDVVWAGSNFANDWRAYESDEGSDAEIGVKGVSGSRETRTIEVARQGFGPLSAAEYLFIEAGANRIYEDRAGNRHAPQARRPVSGAL